MGRRGELRRAPGLEAIRAFFGELQSSISWALHHFVGPLVSEVGDGGDTASAGWYLWMPYLGSDGDERASMLLMAKQFDRYRREDGVWKFAEIRIEVQAIGRFEPGWPVTAPTAV